jgi:hypothetical protein
MEVIELDTGTFYASFQLTFGFMSHFVGFILNIFIIDFGSSFSGILTDEQVRVQALWASFSTQVSWCWELFTLVCFFKY